MPYNDRRDTTRHDTTDGPTVLTPHDMYITKRQFLVCVESKCSSWSAQKPAIRPHLCHPTPSQPASRHCDKSSAGLINLVHGAVNFGEF